MSDKYYYWGVSMENANNVLGKRERYFDNIAFAFFFSIIVYIAAAFYNDTFINIMSVTDFLTWHIIFEFVSIVVSFSIFTVTYFSYEESERLSMLILGCTFLSMAILDAFHTLSFKGMSDFLVSNTTSNRATTLWIAARMIGCLGFLSSVTFLKGIKIKVSRKLIVTLTVTFSVLIFLLTTYHPDVFPVMHIEGVGITKLKIILEYFIILIFGLTFSVLATEYIKENSKQDHMFMISLVLLMFSEFAFTNYGSVYDAYNYIGHIYKIIAYIVFYKSIYLENLSEPYREMKKARNELENYTENLNEIVMERTKELEEMNMSLLRDVEYAKEVQKCLMPAQLPKDSDITISAKYLPAERLSGDFYNVIRLDEDNIALYIGDVSGHGVSAAMLTVFAYQNIVPLKEEENKNDEIISPGFVLKTMYKRFNKTNFNSGTYIVMLYGIYNIKKKTFTYASAGMNVSPYIVKNTGEVLVVDSKGFPICKLGDQLMPFYDDRILEMESGDKIVFYSDGLVESKNNLCKEYEQYNLQEFLGKNSGLDANELEKSIMKNFNSHMGKDEKLMDDLTLVIMDIN